MMCGTLHRSDLVPAVKIDHTKQSQWKATTRVEQRSTQNSTNNLRIKLRLQSEEWVQNESVKFCSGINFSVGG